MKNIVLIAFILFFTYSFGQEKVCLASKQNSISLAADQFLGYDSFGYYYSIKNNVLSKNNAKESFEYKNISLGKPTKIDIQNPLKIMLFYENFNTLILLDNQLSETQKINFSENDIPIVANATGIASQNRLWVYNSLTQKLGFFDYLKNTFQSLTPSLSGNLKYYETSFTTFQWIDDQLNWYSCDVFGKVTTLGKVTDFNQIQIISNQEIVFSKDGKLFLQDLKTNSIYTIENVEKSFKNFFYKDQILSIFTNQEITNYKITIP
ncbi:hypothetical protein [Flavobacterium alvei]|uniref:hypothetical protein n=1 Tax=Flavobacterium alvei TaxID=2080416 RepID=UPI0026EB1979|nr:hypothetical protein [Flavobacterium alvei]